MRALRTWRLEDGWSGDGDGWREGSGVGMERDEDG